MRRASELTLVVAMATTVAHAPVVLARPADPRREIEGAYARLAQAYQRQSVRDVLMAMTDDYIRTVPSGATFTRQQVQEAADRDLARMRFSVSFMVDSLLEHGQEVVAAVTVTMRPLTASESDPSAPTRAAMQRQRDTWVRTGASWKLRRTEVVGTQARKRHDGPTDPLTALLDEVAASVGKLGTLEARLHTTQWTVDEHPREPDWVGSGTVRPMKPNYARIVIDGPAKQTVASDGTTLWFVDHASRSYQRRRPASAASIFCGRAPLVSCFFPVWARSIGQRPGETCRWLGS